MMHPVVRARGLTKRFGSRIAVGGIDLDVAPGECFGLLGPNGAGKTTVIRMITCVSPPTAGSLTVVEHDVRSRPRAVKGSVGVVPQDNNLDEDLTVEENLRAYGRYFGLDAAIRGQRIDESLALLQLDDRRTSPIGELSGGMKRRLVIARALMNDPRLLVLDEPSTGLDPQARHVVWNKLRVLRGRGITLLLTTHYMDEAAVLCDRVAVMDTGRIVAQGSPAALIAEHAGHTVVEARFTAGATDTAAASVASLGPFDVEASGDTLYVFASDGADPRAAADSLAGADRVTVRPANLEDVFLRLTGRRLQD